MIKLEHTEVFGWSAALRGMRNAFDSHAKSDSYWTHIEDPETLETANFQHFVGENDKTLMISLSRAGKDHSKFLRMINVTVDITAPLYWWKEFDTYKVGTVANSCSTMHTLHKRTIEMADFSVDNADETSKSLFTTTIAALNYWRKQYIDTKDVTFWRALIQHLPSSYNQKRTVQLNYQVLQSMYFARRQHKLQEWRDLCDWMLTLPHFRDVCVEPLKAVDGDA